MKRIAIIEKICKDVYYEDKAEFHQLPTLISPNESIQNSLNLFHISQMIKKNLEYIRTVK